MECVFGGFVAIGEGARELQSSKGNEKHRFTPQGKVEREWSKRKEKPP